jgi:hypothetical protein
MWYPGWDPELKRDTREKPWEENKLWILAYHISPLFIKNVSLM